jgi:hypothetical protein
VLLGEPGIGKTALLDYARERAEGMLVAGPEGLAAEAELPFASLSLLLQPLLHCLKELPAAQGSLWPAPCGARRVARDPDGQRI